MRRSQLTVALLALLLWTAFLAFMFQRELRLDEERIRGIALSQSRTLFDQVVDMRSWNSSHGGVYVEVTERSPPNPYLALPERDLETTTGRRLTLLNPAYMTRQLAEIARARRGIEIHLTSLAPLRPGNVADPWERAALTTFEGGATETAEFTTDARGRAVFRFMAPLAVEEPCLGCHRGQGYRLGQVRGGLSISYPADHLLRSRADLRRSVLLASLALWVLGASLTAALAYSYHQKQRLIAGLRELALEDELTGLHNRRGLLVLAEKQVQIARRSGRPDLLLFMDLDDMKRINDEHGHDAGDEALRRAAGILRAAFRQSDILGRYGGDEFVALCPDTTPAAAPAILQSLERHAASADALAATPWKVTLSVGIAPFDPRRPATLEELIRAADAEMYREKERRRAGAG